MAGCGQDRDAGGAGGAAGQGMPPAHEGTGGQTGGASHAGGQSGGTTDAGGPVDAGATGVGGGGAMDGAVGGPVDAPRITDARTNDDATDGGPPPPDAGANLISIFNGTTLDGWIQVPAASWSVVNGAMHSLGTARGFIYTRATYQDFRAVFTSRLVADPAAHLPCVLFWGNSPTVDALAAVQIQPPRGYMWDYRRTGPTANMSPDRFETRLGGPALVDTQWSQCEILTNRAAGTMRFACCQLTGTATRCKGAEIVDFKDPTAGLEAPLAFQVHNAGMIEEFKNIFVESPVAVPSMLVTPQWP
jgi:hypothetical protein